MAHTRSDSRQTVLITGAGIGGIGGELVKAFHAKGYRVFAAVRRSESALQIQGLGWEVETFQIDVTNSEDIRRARADISQRTGGRLDVLVNNAGKAIPMPATDLDIDHTVREMYEVNVFGAMRMVKEFARLLIAAEGTIVNISSCSPVFPLVYGSGYNSTKAALTAYGDTLRVEMKPFNVHVMTIMSGVIKSNIIRTEKAYLPADSLYQASSEGWYKRTSKEGPLAIGTPTDQFASNVVAQITKKRSSQPLWYWTGKYSTLGWLLTYILPRGFYDNAQIKRFDMQKLAKQFHVD